MGNACCAATESFDAPSASTNVQKRHVTFARGSMVKEETKFRMALCQVKTVKDK